MHFRSMYVEIEDEKCNHLLVAIPIFDTGFLYSHMQL